MQGRQHGNTNHLAAVICSSVECRRETRPASTATIESTSQVTDRQTDTWTHGW